MKKYILIVFLGLFSLSVAAQTQITVSGKITNADTHKPFKSEMVMVYSYATKADLEECLKIIEEKSEMGDPYNGLKEIGLTTADQHSGYYELKCYSNGWLLIRAGLANQIESVKGRMTINVAIDAARVMNEVVISGMKGDPGEISPIPKSSPRFGNMYPMILDLTLPDHKGRDNARFIYQPFVVDCETDSIEGFGRPYIIDGKDFKNTQNRRMGYDLRRDSLDSYVDKDKRLTKERFVIHYADTISVKYKDHNYAVFGSFSFLDYNNIYYTKSTMINDCRNIILMDKIEMDKFPPRYLDRNSDLYKKIAERKERPVPGNIEVNFLAGKSEPNMSDSITQSNLSGLVAMLKEISSGAVLKSLTIEGVASPDGGYELNDGLARRRTSFLMDFVTRNLTVRGFTRKVTSRVASWAELADTIQQDDADYAQKLRSIISAGRSHDVQSQLVARSGLLKEEKMQRYLSRLRKVNYECVYIINRALTPNEIYQKYKDNPNDNFLPYEYWNLFQLVKDTAELEDLYKRGIEANKVYENGKPWVLPENLLAASYINRDTFDVHLLTDIIDRTPISAKDKRPKLNYIKRDFYGRSQLINPEPVVANHLIMCLKARDFEDAGYMASIMEQGEPTEENLNLIAFAKCMRGLYVQDRNAFDRVRKTSAVNEVIMDVMMGTNHYNKEARKALDSIPNTKAIYWYLKAILDDRTPQTTDGSFASMMVLPAAVSDLLECYKLDESYIRFSQRDGSIKEAIVKEALQEYEMNKQEEKLNLEGEGN